jgi:DNA-binding winged helix-turn-helix (wHTH) protein
VAGPAYTWGTWRFEPAECRLSRGDEVMSLHAKSLDLLHVLVRRAPRLVTKEEIMASVWPDAAVEGANIAVHIGALRKALDEGDGRSLIETVRGRGYRFAHDMVVRWDPPDDNAAQAIAAVSAAGSTASATAVTNNSLRPRARPAALTFLVVAVGVAIVSLFTSERTGPLPTIAVVAPEADDADVGGEPLSDALIAALVSQLEHAGVRVVPPASAAARLSGQTQPTATGVRVTVGLTRSVDGMRIWDWSFDSAEAAESPVGGTPPDYNVARTIAEGVKRYVNANGVAFEIR